VLRYDGRVRDPLVIAAALLHDTIEALKNRRLPRHSHPGIAACASIAGRRVAGNGCGTGQANWWVLGRR
jgi:HD superfamily phosphodiesterase